MEDALGKSSEHKEASSEHKEASSEHKETSSEHKEASSEHKETSSEHKETSSEHKEASSEHKSWEKVKKTRRASPEEIITAILDFCSESEKTLDEIADAIGRSKDTVRTHYLKELLEKGLLNLKFPEIKNHPNQRYIVKK